MEAAAARVLAALDGPGARNRLPRDRGQARCCTRPGTPGEKPGLRSAAGRWASEAALLLERRSRRAGGAGRPPARPHLRVHPGGPGGRPRLGGGAGCGGRSHGNRGCPRARARPSTPGWRSTSAPPACWTWAKRPARTTTSMRPTGWTPWWRRSAIGVGATGHRPMSRCRWRRGLGTWWSGAGSTPSSGTPTAAGTWWTGRPAAGPPRPAARSRPSSSPSTGWPGPGSRAFRWTRSAPRSYYVADNQVVRPHDLGSRRGA